LSSDGLGVLLVEQAVEDAMRVADHFSVLDVGRVVVSGTADEAGDASVIREAYLGRLS
jgi:ABC-type branched-subunit amino acid transport system ATPase component